MTSRLRSIGSRLAGPSGNIEIPWTSAAALESSAPDGIGFIGTLDENDATGIPDFAVLRGSFGGPRGPSGLLCSGSAPCVAASA